MEPHESWMNDWKMGLSPSEEEEISRALLEIFRQFWHWAELDKKAKVTQRRYGASLHALGGWAVEKMLEDEELQEPGYVRPSLYQLLVDATFLQGPLIHYDNKKWQSEVDTVCRKLHKFLVSRGE